MTDHLSPVDADPISSFPLSLPLHSTDLTDFPTADQLLGMGVEEFEAAMGRAQQLMEELEVELPDGQQDERKEEEQSSGSSTPSSFPPRDLFTAWAQRIQRLQVLNIEEEIAAEPAQVQDPAGTTLRQPHYTTPKSSVSLALSLSSTSPECQLLRSRILLAQEEARSVAMEDRVGILTHQLTSCRQEIAALKSSNASLTSKNVQLISNSNGCSNGCGLMRLENGTLKKQNAALKHSLQLCETQLQQVHKEMMAARKAQQLPPGSRSTGSDSATTTPPSATSATSASSSSTAASPTSPSASTAALPSTVSLLRLRSSFALARLILHHHHELSELQPYKLHHHAQQQEIDGLEDALEVARQLLSTEHTEHAFTRVQLSRSTADLHASQEIVAHLAQQLQRYVRGQGMGMSVSMSPREDNNEEDTQQTRSPGFHQVTPMKPTVLLGTSSSTLHTTPVPAAGPLSATNSTGKKGWGLGWMFGSGSKKDKAAAAAAAAANAGSKSPPPVSASPSHPPPTAAINDAASPKSKK